MTGPGEGDELLLLWTRLGRVLEPLDVPLERSVLALWRDQAAHGRGPIHAASNGRRGVLLDLVDVLQALAGTEDAQAGKVDTHAREG